MNPTTPTYTVGPDRAPIMADGSIRLYREIPTADGSELIGREYPNDGYCWFNLNRAALAAGFTHEQMVRAEEGARAGEYPACVRVHRSSAIVRGIAERGRDTITEQFRFIVRMAVACHAAGVTYGVVWEREGTGDSGEAERSIRR